MKLHYPNFIFFTILFIIEVVIAKYVKQEFVRSIFGDFLVVIMLYYFFKSFLKTKSLYIAILVLFIAYLVEFLQFVDILNTFNIKNNTIVNLILGTTFSVIDLIAYSIGIAAALLIDKKLNSFLNSFNK